MPDERDRRGDAELAELRDLVGRGADVAWETPPEAIWDRIERTVERDLDPSRPVTAPQSLPAAPASARARRVWGLALAAAAVAVAALAAALIVDRQPSPDVIASVDLTRLGTAGSGRAELVDQDGILRLRVETTDLDPADGYLELWLIDSSVTKLVSLGPLRADGIYDLPAGVDPASFPIVDVSVEPVDGDPTHSGLSVLRGELSL